MANAWFLLFILVIGLGLFLKFKTTINKEQWFVIIHSDVNKINIYKLQRVLSNNGIKSRVEFDDALTNHAVRNYYIGDKGSIRKLMVQEKDLVRAKRLLEENR
ncbi:putative signal transducing protein [Anaerobacillus alkaliphilus]|uniref:putative signal transducing protein n=1 Tax=Anaerobacillus alkaliphilus TaxID=1548597 RepID=UPI001375C736|nr:DUF2007 domain-containing protein [Anaerobacillus alkaliphilus]